jgi:hypothetical protein
MKDIQENGYIQLSNILNDDELESGLSCIAENKVDYLKFKQFIDNVFFMKIKQQSDFIKDPIYVKFRLSNNNNSVDASTFHGDIYNHTESEILPIYTCLCYFDDAQLEVIPGSNKYNNSGFSIESYNKKQVLDVKRGDILIFHSNLHHRGINYNKTKNRRLLQVFDVFPDKDTYEEHFPKLTIVKTYDSFLMKQCINPILYEVSKNKTITDCITMVHYILMYNDLHYKMALMDISPFEKKNKYISYEPGKRILLEEITNKEELNVNIICEKDCNSVPYSSFYLFFYILYWIISLIIIYIITKFFYSDYKFKINKLRSRKRYNKQT